MNGNKYISYINERLPINLALRDLKDGWKEVKKGHDITLYTQRYQNSEIKVAKLEGIVPLNYEKIANYYVDNFEAQKKCRKSCEQLLKLEVVDKDTAVTLFKTTSNLIVSSREALSVQHRRKLSENEILITRDPIDDHPNIPKSKDTVRALCKCSAIFLTKINENTTNMVVYFCLDPRGSIPLTITNGVILEGQHEALTKDIEQIKKL